MITKEIINKIVDQYRTQITAEAMLYGLDDTQYPEYKKKLDARHKMATLECELIREILERELVQPNQSKHEDAPQGLNITLSSDGLKLTVDIDHLQKCGIKTFATNGKMFAMYNRTFTRDEATEVIKSMDYQCSLEDEWRTNKNKGDRNVL